MGCGGPPYLVNVPTQLVPQMACGWCWCQRSRTSVYSAHCSYGTLTIVLILAAWGREVPSVLCWVWKASPQGIARSDPLLFHVWSFLDWAQDFLYILVINHLITKFAQVFFHSIIHLEHLSMVSFVPSGPFYYYYYFKPRYH